MNVRYEEGTEQAETLLCSQAIVFYQNNRAALATLHPVATKDGQPPLLLEGTLLTQEALRDLLIQVQGLPQKRTLLPENVLCYDSGRLVWWKPSGRGPIFFNTKEKTFNEAMRGKTVLHPALVFMAEAGRLHVWAIADSVRPTATTPLFRAPYYNLYEGGNMCSGNVKMPEHAVPGEIAVWEKAFFETNFTHTNAAKLTLHPQGHDGLWKDMAGASRQHFPADWLLPLNMTLQEVIDR